MASLIDKYSKEQLQDIVDKSSSIREVVNKLGYNCNTGSNNHTVRKRLEYYNISTGHFSYKKPQERTAENIFCKNSTASQATLRRWYKRIFEPEKCAICGQSVLWNFKPLTMVLDHINGDKHDNEFSNLRWICPNCDSQLETFAGRNTRNT